MNNQITNRKSGLKISTNTRIQDLIEIKTLNMIFYDDSFTKTRFFVKTMSKQNRPIFYFDFDLLYSGYLLANEIPLPKTTTIFTLNYDNLYENFKSTINKISKIKSIIILDSLNGFYNLFEGKNDAPRIINSTIMLLVSAARTVKSSVIIGSLSKLDNENRWALYNNGRHILENDHMTKIHLVNSENTTIKPSNSNNQDFILEI
jgi:hypothetical protein